MSTIALPRFRHAAMLQGLAGPAIIIMILAMMILPLPAIMLDLFFTFNIAFSVMVLLTAMHTTKPPSAAPLRRTSVPSARPRSIATSPASPNASGSPGTT